MSGAAALALILDPAARLLSRVTVPEGLSVAATLKLISEKSEAQAGRPAGRGEGPEALGCRRTRRASWRASCSRTRTTWSRTPPPPPAQEHGRRVQGQGRRRRSGAEGGRGQPVAVRDGDRGLAGGEGDPAGGRAGQGRPGHLQPARPGLLPRHRRGRAVRARPVLGRAVRGRPGKDTAVQQPDPQGAAADADRQSGDRLAAGRGAPAKGPGSTTCSTRPTRATTCSPTTGTCSTRPRPSARRPTSASCRARPRNPRARPLQGVSTDLVQRAPPMAEGRSVRARRGRISPVPPERARRARSLWTAGGPGVRLGRVRGGCRRARCGRWGCARAVPGRADAVGAGWRSGAGQALVAPAGGPPRRVGTSPRWPRSRSARSPGRSGPSRSCRRTCGWPRSGSRSRSSTSRRCGCRTG